ncbi:MAG: N-formylglutamate amidohydrolase [Phycisphaerales bacterium]
MRKRRLILTCEHAGPRVPRQYAWLFQGTARVLTTHRGYDPGALWLAERLARELPDAGALLRTRVSRLLVEVNRSPHHPRLFSEFSRRLTPDQKQRVLRRYYLPHRDAVRARVARAAAEGATAIHVGVHSFTPVLDGVRREADIGLLYDPSRRRERELAVHWCEIIRSLEPGLRVRRNYPYRGASDGLTTSLRQEFPASRYVGIELEVNSGLLVGRAQTRREVCRVLAQSLGAALRE